MLSTDLKTYTKEAHVRLEHRIVARIRQVKDKDGYTDLLALFYGFYHPVEESLAAFQLGEQRSSESILKDLAALGSPTEVPLYEDWPKPTTNAAALGALYVLEGSALGGQFIATMLANQVGAPLPFRFFRFYGEDTAWRWKAFTTYLDESVPAADRAEVLDSANATFAHFNYWIDQYDENRYDVAGAAAGKEL
jgi:heme oxygenase